ncbi:S8 family serine peptidase [Roseateles sp. DAIF2]|uniref:S8 family serine peptidase n=1 Tax=Roseateles sp. DAIF2 TaxID=2714952 RepID=UPI00201E1FB2|nr:S8 family serine peptidase [Roseateles sp. DAIF2]
MNFSSFSAGSSAHRILLQRGSHLMIAIATGLASWGVSAQTAEPEFAKGRLLVQARAGLSDIEMEKVAKGHGGKARRIGKSDLHVIELPGNASERAVQALLAKHPQLRFVELDRRVAPAMAVNDPYAGSQWHLSKIGAQTAWDKSQGAGVTIAILDTGINASHPDLAARMVPGWNFYDNNANTTDVHGHGTAVAGGAAATLNNGVGVAAVAGAARLMPVRIADANAYAYWSTVAQGVTWAADNGARIANISYVGVAGSAAVQSAANYMKSKGGLVIAAAGNNGIEETIAPTSSMIVVSATDSADALASFSSWGSFVTVSAPGKDIWTTTRDGGYQAWWGTSMASPVVSGVLGLMMAAKPALSGSQIESLLYSTAQDLGDVGRDKKFGYGRVNAAAAVTAVLTAAAPDTQAPSVGIAAPLGLSNVNGLVAVDVTASDNVGVSRVELRANGQLVATDTTAPYAFSWDSSKVANGNANLVAYAYDAAGNAGSSAAVTVNVANIVVADTTAPVVSILNPVNGSTVSGTLSISVSASDNAGAAGLVQTLAIDGKTVATGSGASLAYNWNTRKAALGTHTVTATARDAAGNSRSVSVQVTIR